MENSFFELYGGAIIFALVTLTGLIITAFIAGAAVIQDGTIINTAEGSTAIGIVGGLISAAAGLLASKLIADR